MVRKNNRLYSDDRGVWEEDRWSDSADGTEWDDIVEVTGYTEKDTAGIKVWVLLGLPEGRDMSLPNDRPGFADVIEAIGKQLPDMPAGWFAQIERLQPKDDPITVWRRPENPVSPPGGYPRLGADERGIWREYGPGRRFLIEWDKVDEVHGLRGLTPAQEVVCTGLELELAHQGPHSLKLNAASPGFAAVVEAMTAQLPGMPAGWSDRIVQRLTADSVLLWRRPREKLPEGYPKFYADDEGVWQEPKPGRRVGVEWGEVDCVRCVFWEGRGGETVVSVDLQVEGELFTAGKPYGPCLSELVAAMTARLGMPEGWYDQARLMKPTRGALTVWSRPDPSFRLHADDRGVWEGDTLLAEWGTIFGVRARKPYLQGQPDGVILIDLDVANAPRQLLHGSGEGFRDVVEMIGVRLPGMPEGWFAQVEQLQVGHEVTVWQRPQLDGFPRLYADDEGVWRADMPGQPFGVAWDEIGRVLGRKKEGTHGHFVIDLEWVGEKVNHLLLEPDMAGFAEVVEAITSRLPHIPVAWLEKVERLRPGYALWRRDWIIAKEKLGADGMLVTTWRRIEP